jgi:hypothetical protein
LSLTSRTYPGSGRCQAGRKSVQEGRVRRRQRLWTVAAAFQSEGVVRM